MLRLLLVPLGILLAGVVSAAEMPGGSDWPKFQGPAGDGSSPETGLARQWPPGGPPIRWRAAIKPGWGSPSVVGDAVYLGWTEQLRGDQESAVCLSARDGSVRWKHTYDVGPYWKRNIGWARGGYRATPCVAGEHVVFLGAVGHLFCLHRQTGEVLWQRNLWDQWNPSGEKGYVFSPLVEDGKVLLWYSDGVCPANEPFPDPEKLENFFVLCQALDLATGAVVWEFKEPHRPEVRRGEGQTPAIADFAGQRCLVGMANGYLKALRIRDGRQVWQFSGQPRRLRGTTTPTPLILPRAIVNIPDVDPVEVLELDRTDPALPARLLWTRQLDIFTPIHQFRHRAGALYGFAGSIQGVDEKAASDSQLKLTCLDLATGEVRWQQQGFQAGVALTLADGLLFVRSYQTLRLVEADPRQYVLRGQVRTHEVWKPTLNLLDFVQPVLSRGDLYVRTPEELLCYRVAAEPADPRP